MAQQNAVRKDSADSGPGNGNPGKVEAPAVWACAIWTAIWLSLAIWQIVGSWSTLETLQANAAGTTTTITTPTPSASPAPSPSPSSTATGPASTATGSTATGPASTATGSTSSSGAASASGSSTIPPSTPIVTAAPGGPVQAAIPVLGGHVTGSLDLGMFLFALAFGALGATAHCLYVFTGSIGGRKPDFRGYRVGWYFPQPALGAILGALLYVVIRGGLLAASSGASAVNMFGVAAIGAVAGLSAPRAYQLLLRAELAAPQPAAGPPTTPPPQISSTPPTSPPPPTPSPQASSSLRTSSPPTPSPASTPSPPPSPPPPRSSPAPPTAPHAG